MVRHYVKRKAVRHFFETKEEAEQYAREIRETLRSGIDPYEFGEAYRLLAGTGLKLSGIVRAELQFMRDSDAAAASPTATFSDGVKRVLENAKHRRVKTLIGYRSFLGRLEQVFGPRLATSITNSDVQAFLDRLADRRGVQGRATPHTKQTVLRHIRMVLRALGITNPLPRFIVHVPRVREIQFITIDELRAILAATQSRDPPPVPPTYSGNRTKIKVSPAEIAQLVRTMTAIAKGFDCSMALVLRYCRKKLQEEGIGRRVRPVLP